MPAWSIGASPQVIRDLLFKQNSRLDSREVVPFKRTSDFDLDFAYLTETGSVSLFVVHSIVFLRVVI